MEATSGVETVAALEEEAVIVEVPKVKIRFLYVIITHCNSDNCGVCRVGSVTF